METNAVCQILGTVLIAQGRCLDAQKLLEKGIRYSKESNNGAFRLRFELSLARVLCGMNQFDESKEHLEAATEEAMQETTSNHTIELAMISIMFCELHISTAEYDEACEHINKALSLVQEADESLKISLPSSLLELCDTVSSEQCSLQNRLRAQILAKKAFLQAVSSQSSEDTIAQIQECSSTALEEGSVNFLLGEALATTVATPTSTPSSPAATTAAKQGEPIPSNLAKLRKSDLQELLKDRDLPISGKKAELVKRLEEYELEAEAEAEQASQQDPGMRELDDGNSLSQAKQYFEASLKLGQHFVYPMRRACLHLMAMSNDHMQRAYYMSLSQGITHQHEIESSASAKDSFTRNVNQERFEQVCSSIQRAGLTTISVTISPNNALFICRISPKQQQPFVAQVNLKSLYTRHV